MAIEWSLILHKRILMSCISGFDCFLSVGNAECVIAIDSSDLFNGKLFKFGFENSETLELKIFFFE